MATNPPAKKAAAKKATARPAKKAAAKHSNPIASVFMDDDDTDPFGVEPGNSAIDDPIDEAPPWAVDDEPDEPAAEEVMVGTDENGEDVYEPEPEPEQPKRRGRLIPAEAIAEPEPLAAEPGEYDDVPLYPELDSVAIQVGNTVVVYGRENWIKTRVQLHAQEGESISDLSDRTMLAALDANAATTENFLALKEQQRELEAQYRASRQS